MGSYKADSKTTKSSGGAGVESKVAVVQERFSIASLCLTSIKGLEIVDTVTGERDNFEYDFESWITSLKKHLPEDLDIKQFLSCIVNESTRYFKDFDLLIKAGILNPRAEKPNILTKYLISGYDKNKTAHIYQIEFQIDFIGQRVIGPLVTHLHPDENMAGHPFRTSACLGSSIS